MKRVVFNFILAIALLGLPACMQSPDCFSKDVFCAGLVTDTSGIKDHGLNQDAWEGLQQAQKDGSADYVAYIDSVGVRDYIKNLTAFTQAGYDVIITVGPGLRDETLQSADLVPDSVFIGLDQPQMETRPNLMSITFPEDQEGFAAGALAARLTETGMVGAVCETSGIDAMWRTCEGFRNGVAYADKNVKALVVYRENGSSETLFFDSNWGNAAAQDFIQRGADVIFAAGGGTGEGALVAAAEAHIYAIGAEQDQAQALAEARPAVVTSIYGRASLEVQKWMRLIRDGHAIEAESIGAVGFVQYREVKKPIPDSLKLEMEQLLLALSSGDLETKVPASAP